MALRLPRRVLRLAGRRADAIIAVSGAVRDSLLGGAEIAPSRVRVIGVASRFAPAANVPHTDDRRDARRALGLPAAGHWLGFFGGTDAGKGLDHALGATVAANHASPPVHLLAGGHRAGSQDAGLVAARARDVGLEGRVHWRGRIERMEVALRAVDVVVVPTRSRLGEAMPLTVAEAMALGTPVVAYAVGGIPEILGGGVEAGRRVTADDSDAFARAVVEALADAGETRARAERALARVRTHFAVDAMAAAYEELFLGLLRK
jgi:mannosyltransferase